ncbi:MAG: sensor histidine kinase [Steroidobacteraceae bacterium]|jgi:two-component system sensor histidine kinase AlgZ|nr:sensor histidine kinase [Pseudomonadota bacterium]MBP9128635.1 sensor histidine kinase [Steroidobacteraceae bacterium]
MSVPAAAPERSRVDERDFFLPDFCEARAVLAIVLIAALLGFVLALALARQSGHGTFWFDLARTTAFLLWAGLLCAAMLCRSRAWLAGKSLRASIAWSLALMVGTVAVLSEAVYQLGRLWTVRLGAPSAILPDSHWSFVLPNVMIAAVVGAMTLRYFYVSQQWRRSVELEARARIHALQARIRPHFLFNSMNTIASLTRSNPVQAEEAIEDLSDLFRVSLSDARAQITLQEEIEIARTYQRIEQLRLGDRLQVRWDVGALPPRCMVPSLLLQPLLENAIGHGIEPLPQGGIVDVRGRLDDGVVTLEVTNPKPSGTPPPLRRGHRMALDNIRQRLDLAFPGRATVEVDVADSRYTVRLRFPRAEDESAAPAAAPRGAAALPS